MPPSSSASEYDHSKLSALGCTVDDVDELEKASPGQGERLRRGAHPRRRSEAKKDAADAPTATNIHKALVVEAGKMRLLAVSSPVDVEIEGRKLQTLKDQGIELELTNWRAIFAPPGISENERRRITEWVTKVTQTPSWKENVKRYDWTAFVKTDSALDDFLASEQARVEKTVDELGIGQ